MTDGRFLLHDPSLAMRMQCSGAVKGRRSLAHGTGGASFSLDRSGSRRGTLHPRNPFDCPFRVDVQGRHCHRPSRAKAKRGDPDSGSQEGSPGSERNPKGERRPGVGDAYNKARRARRKRRRR